MTGAYCVGRYDFYAGRSSWTNPGIFIPSLILCYSTYHLIASSGHATVISWDLCQPFLL